MHGRTRCSRCVCRVVIVATMNYSPIFVKEENLSTQDVVDIINKYGTSSDGFSDSSIITEPCVQPKGGQVFLFSAEKDPSKKSDWKCDQYRWLNNGVTKLPKRDPIIKKHYFYIELPNGHSKEFQRHAYHLLNNDKVVLVHYIGNEKVAVDYQHKNATRITAPLNFVRTCPSVIDNLKKECTVSTANTVYKKEISSVDCLPEHMAVAKPRNMKQVRNVRSVCLQESRISRDALYNMHEIAYDIDGFVWKIITYPNLVCVFGLRGLLEELDKVLCLQIEGQVLSYDTTFQLGDFFLSPFLFRHVLFNEKPCVPAIFLLHERKFTDTHVELFRVLKECVPSISKTKSPIVLDREKAIVSAITNTLPDLPIVFCWNHIYRDIRFWLRANGTSSSVIAMYLEDVFQLFHQATKEAYLKLLDQVCKRWEAKYEQYYKKNIHSQIDQHIGRWILEKHGCYHPYSGITNNCSESMNRVIKDLQKWKEAPCDSMLLSLYQLQLFYLNEIKRGLAGLGEYSLAPSYKYLLSPIVNCLPIKLPQDIVSAIKESHWKVFNCPPSNSVPVSQLCSTEDTSTCISNVPESRHLSSFARAKLIVETDKLSFNSKLQVFNVEGSSGVPRVVTLFPKPSCSCPSIGDCYHILAVKMSLRMPLNESSMNNNLTQLRKNTRTRADKKSGRKRPRMGDISYYRDEDEVKSQVQTDLDACNGDSDNRVPRADSQQNVKLMKCQYNETEMLKQISNKSFLTRLEESSSNFNAASRIEEDLQPLDLVSGQFALFKSFDVVMWLNSRQFYKKNPLREVDDFVIIDNELEKEFDELKRSLIGAYYIEENDLLHYWSNQLDTKDHPLIISKFGKKYFQINDTLIDNLYTWIDDTRKLIESGEKVFQKSSYPSSCELAECHSDDASLSHCKESFVNTTASQSSKNFCERKIVSSTSTVNSTAVISTTSTVSTIAVKRTKGRCMSCKGCKVVSDCGHCVYCKDKKKFGGPGIKKKGCMNRICTGRLQTEKHVKPCTNSVYSFLSAYDRQQHIIAGDGNCLYRCFSYILFNNEKHHLDVRSILGEFMLLNSSLFVSYCHPSDVIDHVNRIQKPGQWGTQAEILAMAIFFAKPIFVALQKNRYDGDYYWAKFSNQCSNVVYPKSAGITKSDLPDIPHLEICHINGNHYNVVLGMDNKLPTTPPYTSDTSCNLQSL